MNVLAPLLTDLAAEGDRLRAAVGRLEDDQWHAPTPARGWDVATQIVHLAWTDEASLLATRAAAGAVEEWDALVLRAIEDPEGFADSEAAEGARARPVEILARWDIARPALSEALGAATGKLPWFGPPMSPASMATARLMETWAHGLDVYDALGITPERTDAVRHICHLGVRTRAYAYAARGLEAPAAEVRVDLTLPSGEVVHWSSTGRAEGRTPPEGDAPQTITGSAWDFARLVTQRVHRADTDLLATGAEADEWLSVAQAFAGPPGPGRSQKEPR